MGTKRGILAPQAEGLNGGEGVTIYEGNNPMGSGMLEGGDGIAYSTYLVEWDFEIRIRI